MSRRNIAVVVVVLVALVAGWYLLAWSPMGSQVTASHADKAAAETKASELRTTLQRLRSLQARRPEVDAALARVQAAVPPKAQLAEFILATNDLSSRTGLDFLTITPTTPTAGVAGAPTTITVSLAMQGKYQPTLDFLDGLMKLPRLMVIDSFHLTPQAVFGEVSLGVDLTGRLFISSGVPTAGTATPATTPAAPTAPTATTAAPTATAAAPVTTGVAK